MSDLDLLIIGAGPAGLTAAQYGARANLKTLVIEHLSVGGQALVIDVLENYPGGGEKSGYEFIEDLHKQAKAFGANFFSGTVNYLKKGKDGRFEASLSDGTEHKAKAVILATGAKPRLLGVPGELEYAGKGVSYCATCDGNFFKGKKIFVVGGGDAACDEARYLSRLTDKIVLIHRRDSFRAQKALVQRTLSNPNITVRYNTVIKEIKGEPKLNAVSLMNTLTKEIYEEETDAVFIFAGTVPQVSLAENLKVQLDENGYIITNQKMATNIDGVFAAGDVRSGAFRQVITAAADGATAAHHAAGYIDEN
ncbi:MAG: thioredoxin-disulfide reductase [Treponema sp.]|nr:thioredoxin-disulfide reductase [Treponema sp.]MCL2236822.1 thioredoxin-disulfide reductase [Treponema sp.]